MSIGTNLAAVTGQYGTVNNQQPTWMNGNLGNAITAAAPAPNPMGFPNQINLNPATTQTAASIAPNGGALHTNAKNFKTIQPQDKGLSADTKAILKKFKINGDQEHAYLSQDGSSLVLAITGQNAAKNLFSSSWFGAGHKKYGLRRYQELYDPAKNEALTARAEDKKHLTTNLRNNHYHVQVLFKKNAEGKFDLKQPQFITVTDSFWFAAQHSSKFADGAETEAAQDKYQNVFTVDKAMAADGEKDLQGGIMTIMEAMMQKPGWSQIWVPGTVNSPDPKINSTVLPWQHSIQSVNDQGWSIENGHVSILRPASEAHQPIDPETADLYAHTQSFSGADPVVSDESHRAALDRAVAANKQTLATSAGYVQTQTMQSPQQGLMPMPQQAGIPLAA